MSETDVLLRTPGLIAESLGVPLHRVLHILSTRAHIKPSARAGTLRVYDSATVAMIRHELNAQDARRAEREAGKGAIHAAR